MDFVGNCSKCQTAVYCKGGFLDGVTEHHVLYCHSCFAAVLKEREQAATASGQGDPQAQRDPACNE
ncbi:hypothetical protein [Paenibacillus ginsengarvi]|uniref:LIM zinc-binding domain-containing protein n=1 Tax=Paenibacillus ginsengarvi TaxID=400777 RepID=A0A3B0CFV7_9BACL|nr:hypothetical protein [Paenibacillus ginsengarvi]RKN83798.1 hypothetical protein D7M11_16520 [Paenibacillus ginsengarvi]